MPVDKGAKSVVDFHIDDAPQSDNSDHLADETYELDLSAFLKQLTRETLDNFSFSTNKVKKAGRALRKKEGDLKEATVIIQAFRAAHEVPLETISYLIGRCCKELNISVKPVKRLKRLETIIDKLQRRSLDGKQVNQTCVTNMNDIGGCRVIFPDMDSLKQVQQKLESVHNKDTRILIKDIDDYISTPKKNDCGYRSLHIIYQYKSNEGKQFRIEAQLRTVKQHLWATTVEIIDIIEKTKIKTHSHSPCYEKDPKQIMWEELLSIMSNYIASTEGTYYLDHGERMSMTKRLKELDQKLNAITRLESFKMISEKIDQHHKGPVLILVNEQKMEVVIQESFQDKAEAIQMYNGLEKIISALDGFNLLLVSMGNLNYLSEAYPNYIGDCSQFISLLKSAMKFES